MTQELTHIDLPETEDEDEADTDEEFRALYMDATDAQARFEELAKLQETNNRPELASVYREIGGTILSLISDMTMSTGGALSALEDTVEGLVTGEATESILMPQDAKEYVDYFEQVLRLLDGLDKVVPAGAAGDDQRKIFGALRRMTTDRIEFTKAIAVKEDDDDPEDETETDEE